MLGIVDSKPAGHEDWPFLERWREREGIERMDIPELGFARESDEQVSVQQFEATIKRTLRRVSSDRPDMMDRRAMEETCRCKV